jgi:alkylhydroperoxidase family enzyme
MLERESATSTRTAEARVVKVAAKGGPKIVVAAKDAAPLRLSKMIVAARAGAVNASVKAVAAHAVAKLRERIGSPIERQSAVYYQRFNHESQGAIFATAC